MRGSARQAIRHRAEGRALRTPVAPGIEIVHFVRPGRVRAMACCGCGCSGCSSGPNPSEDVNSIGAAGAGAPDTGGS